MSPVKQIYRLCAACAALAILALIVPRFASNPEGGFAAGATAVLVFLAMLAAALLLSIYLLVVTVRHFRQLPRAARVAGIVPCVVFATALVGLIVYLRY